MVSGPTNITSTPVMRFRPDPGEPAANLAIKEPQSAGLVTLQEQRNETRLLMRAMAQGEDVVYSKRTFTLGLGDVSPTYNGGLTTVVTKPDGNGYLPDTIYQVLAARQNQAPASEETEKPEETGQEEENQEAQAEQGSMENLQSAAQPSEEELDQKQQDVESENRQLERNLLRAQLERDRAVQNGNAVEAQQADRKEAELERKKEDNEEEQRQVEQEQFQQKLEEFQQNADRILSENVAAATSILGVLFGGNNSEGNGQNAPTVSAQPTRPSTPNIPRFSFAG